MCANTHLLLSMHLINGRVYWAVFDTTRAGTRVQLGRGTIESPLPSLYHSPATHLMEAAYEAYRAMGE